jgi:hypothetical protein
MTLIFLIVLVPGLQSFSDLMHKQILNDSKYVQIVCQKKNTKIHNLYKNKIVLFESWLVASLVRQQSLFWWFVNADRI